MLSTEVMHSCAFVSRARTLWGACVSVWHGSVGSCGLRSLHPAGLNELHTFVPATLILRKRVWDDRVVDFQEQYRAHVEAARARRHATDSACGGVFLGCAHLLDVK